MSVVNKIQDGDFTRRDLTHWTTVGGPSYVANVGNDELGCAYLESGDSISQEIVINVGREYMVEVATKGASTGNLTLTIANQDGDTMYTTNITVVDYWTVWCQRIGLPWGTHTLKLAYNDVAVYVDDVSVAYVIKTREELVDIVDERLGLLASNASLTRRGDDDETEGDYTHALDAALRTVGAVDPAGLPDVRYLDSNTLDQCLDELELNMLHRLHRYWSTKTDYTIGPRTERISQVNAAIERLIGIAVGGRSASSGRGVAQRRLVHDRGNNGRI